MARFFNYMTGKLGSSGFGSKSTAEEVSEGIDLSGKVAIVTGASSGIGEDSARVLALRGAHVLAVRKPESAENVKSTILSSKKEAKVDVMELDLSSLKSVETFVGNFKAKSLPLNILLNNAGVMMSPFQLSKDGYEMQFATNHLGHFHLTNLLLPILKDSANKSGSESRIVVVSSMAHKSPYSAGILFEDLNNEQKYSRGAAYGQSKLANLLFVKELARRLKADGVTNVTVNALCPGGIRTKLQRHLPQTGAGLVMTTFRPLMKSIPQGAATSLYVATSPQLNGVSGKYFTDCNENSVVAKQADDEELAKKLWNFSEELVAKAKTTQS